MISKLRQIGSTKKKRMSEANKKITTGERRNYQMTSVLCTYIHTYKRIYNILLYYYIIRCSLGRIRIRDLYNHIRNCNSIIFTVSPIIVEKYLNFHSKSRLFGRLFTTIGFNGLNSHLRAWAIHLTQC